MNYDLRFSGASLTLSLIGSLTFVDGDLFKEALAEIEAASQTFCIVEMSRLSFVDSFGLGLLVVLYDLAEKRRMRLVLRHASGIVRERLNYTEFDSIMSLED